jgi:hypothetical protein
LSRRQDPFLDRRRDGLVELHGSLVSPVDAARSNVFRIGAYPGPRFVRLLGDRGDLLRARVYPSYREALEAAGLSE